MIPSVANWTACPLMELSSCDAMRSGPAGGTVQENSLKTDTIRRQNSRAKPGRERDFKMKNVISKTVLTAIVLAANLMIIEASANEPPLDTPVVNINNATVVELAYLPGIGPSTAEQIVRYRKGRPFVKPFHITRVKGIGKKTFGKIKKYISVNKPTTATGKIKINKS
jgi:competence protein ComEA